MRKGFDVNDATSALEIRSNMSPEDAWTLLRRLATDDDFRAQVEADVQAALSDYDVSVSGTAVGAGAALPSKEAMAEVVRLADPDANLAEVLPPAAPPFATCFAMTLALAAAATVRGGSAEAAS
jgi:putative modified peptide